MNAAPAIMAQAAPRFTSQQASRIAEHFYGIDAQAKLLVAERDQNFLLISSSGDRFLLKIANQAEDPAVCCHQSEVLHHIEITDPNIPVPRMMPARDGQLECRVISESGDEHLVRLLTWLDGLPLEKDRPSIALARQMGAALARLDQALGSFSGEVPGQDLLWDLQQAESLTPLLAKVNSAELRQITARRLEHFIHKTLPKLQGMKRQLIYNDLNPSNVLVKENDPDCLAGIIDFGDMVEAPLVIELAVACAYLVEPGEAEPFQGMLELLRAYCEVNPLHVEEIQMIDETTAMRWVQTVVITHWRASEHPQNRDYILRNEPRAAAALRMLETIDTAELNSLIMQSCTFEKSASQ